MRYYKDKILVGNSAITEVNVLKNIKIYGWDLFRFGFKNKSPKKVSSKQKLFIINPF